MEFVRKYQECYTYHINTLTIVAKDNIMNKEELQDIARNIILEGSLYYAHDDNIFELYGISDVAEQIRELMYSANIDVSWDE